MTFDWLIKRSKCYKELKANLDDSKRINNTLTEDLIRKHKMIEALKDMQTSMEVEMGRKNIRIMQLEAENQAFEKALELVHAEITKIPVVDERPYRGIVEVNPNDKITMPFAVNAVRFEISPFMYTPSMHTLETLIDSLDTRLIRKEIERRLNNV